MNTFEYKTYQNRNKAFAEEYFSVKCVKKYLTVVSKVVLKLSIKASKELLTPSLKLYL